jgi:alpha-glucosidase
MVGSDVCGFAGNTTETLCARWATLGAFSPFYRNHNSNDAISQEFYRWPSVAQAAKTAIDARYRMLDYIYTAMWKQTQDGRPLLSPLWFLYPEDMQTFALQYQYMYGPGIMVAPVTEENSTSVTIYVPDDLFYDYFNPTTTIRGPTSANLTNVAYTTIPLYIRGGTILPLRINSANTTTELRKQDFEIVIAPGLDGTASGELYLDEGDAIEQPQTSLIKFSYANGMLKTAGTFGYNPGVKIAKITLLGAGGKASAGSAGGTYTENKISTAGGLALSLTEPISQVVGGA